MDRQQNVQDFVFALGNLTRTRVKVSIQTTTRESFGSLTFTVLEPRRVILSVSSYSRIALMTPWVSCLLGPLEVVNTFSSFNPRTRHTMIKHASMQVLVELGKNMRAWRGMDAIRRLV